MDSRNKRNLCTDDPIQFPTTFGKMPRNTKFGSTQFKSPMEVSSHHLLVQKTARYHMLGELDGTTKRIWFVLHGYGQLSEFFVKHFTEIADEETVVIAPEALSRFYLNGEWGRVGATWMTKEDRLSEIDDYVDYLDRLLEFALSRAEAEDIEITVLGFSQGVATAWRWMRKGKVRPANFVLWAGSIPDEVQFEWVERFKRMRFCAVLGTQDQYITPEKAVAYKEKLTSIHPGVESFTFEGDHRMDKPTLAAVVKRLEEMRTS